MSNLGTTRARVKDYLAERKIQPGADPELIHAIMRETDTGLEHALLVSDVQALLDMLEAASTANTYLLQRARTAEAAADVADTLVLHLARFIPVTGPAEFPVGTYTTVQRFVRAKQEKKL